MADLPDPYGIDIAIGETGDLVIWPNGQLATLSGTDNCVQALKLRFRTQHGELPLEPEYGSELMTHRFIGAKQDGDQLTGQAKVELRRLIEQDARFLQAADVEVSQQVDGAGNIPVPQGVQVSVKLGLAGGEQIATTDLHAPRIDEVQDPTTTDLADLQTISELDDFEFIAQDAEEQAALADAAAVTELVDTGSVD